MFKKISYKLKMRRSASTKTFFDKVIYTEMIMSAISRAIIANKIDFACKYKYEQHILKESFFHIPFLMQQKFNSGDHEVFINKTFKNNIYAMKHLNDKLMSS